MLYITSLNRLKRYKATMLNRSISNIFTILITKRMPQKQIISLFKPRIISFMFLITYQTILSS
jgi:hypothetical protein